MLKCKEGVQIEKLTPQLLFGLIILNDAYTSEDADCVVTSIFDGAHSVRGKHPEGNAVDTRVNDLAPTQIARILTQANLALPKGFDLLHEYAGQQRAHFHLEYDPK